MPSPNASSMVGTNLRPLHSNCVTVRQISSSGQQLYDLAVNPLSVVLLRIRPLNSTATITNYQDILNAVAATVSNVQILYRGEVIKNFSGADLLAMLWFRYGIVPWEAMPNATTGYQREIVVPIFMGKNPYDPVSCFPATHRGELSLSITFVTGVTGLGSLYFAADTIELLNANPTEYEKQVYQQYTYVSTGQNDVDFNIGNVFRNVLAYDSTGFTGASPAPTLATMQILLGNIVQHYNAINFETANVMSMLWGRQQPMFRHVHGVNAPASTQTPTNLLYQGGQNTGSTYDFGNYAWIDFDPTKDDMYSLDTAGTNRFHLRATVGTAALARFIPTEVIQVVAGSAGQ